MKPSEQIEEDNKLRKWAEDVINGRDKKETASFINWLVNDKIKAAEEKLEFLDEIHALNDKLTEKETELKNKELALSSDRLGKIEALNEQTRLLQKSAIVISAVAIAISVIKLISR